MQRARGNRRYSQKTERNRLSFRSAERNEENRPRIKSKLALWLGMVWPGHFDIGHGGREVEATNWGGASQRMPKWGEKWTWSKSTTLESGHL